MAHPILFGLYSCDTVKLCCIRNCWYCPCKHCLTLGIQVNVIPCGVDRMETVSSDQLSSYLHWYYWCRILYFQCWYFFGIIWDSARHNFTSLLVSSFASAISVLINIFGYKWLIKREKVGNLLLLIYHGLRYAVSAKRPAERSVF